MDKKPRILVVDDEPIIRKSLARVLSEQYEIFILNSGQHFDEMVEDVQPDLVIMDVMMPGITGLQLCIRLRTKKVLGRVPVLFLSGLTDEKDAVAAMAAGGDFYLGKPFEITHLRSAVEHLMGRPHRYPNDPVPDEPGPTPDLKAA